MVYQTRRIHPARWWDASNVMWWEESKSVFNAWMMTLGSFKMVNVVSNIASCVSLAPVVM